MTVTAIGQANGADLLNLYSQSVGRGAATSVEASVDLLKKALAEASLSTSEVLAGSGDSASQLNVFA
jgi:hypothetical protein